MDVNRSLKRKVLYRYDSSGCKKSYPSTRAAAVPPEPPSPPPFSSSEREENGGKNPLYFFHPPLFKSFESFNIPLI